MNDQEPTPASRKNAPERKDLNLAARLHRKARSIVEKQSPQLWDSSPRSLIARQLALTLEELERTREMHRQLMLGHLRAECELDTALLQPPRGPEERHRLQAQLIRLQMHRRDLALQEHQSMSQLTHRLLEFVNRWVHVVPEDERG